MTNLKPITNPLWTPQFKDPMGQKEIAFMKRYYDDVDSIIASADAFDWEQAPHYQFQFQIGTYNPLTEKWWNGDKRRWENVPHFWRELEGENGLIQKCVHGAMAHAPNNNKHLITCAVGDYWMIPPVEIDGKSKYVCSLLWGAIGGARCRHILGLQSLQHQR